MSNTTAFAVELIVFQGKLRLCTIMMTIGADTTRSFVVEEINVTKFDLLVHQRRPRFTLQVFRYTTLNNMCDDATYEHARINSFPIQIFSIQRQRRSTRAVLATVSLDMVFFLTPFKFDEIVMTPAAR